MKVCLHEERCFARWMFRGTPLCTILTDTYADKKCPFCKPYKDEPRKDKKGYLNGSTNEDLSRDDRSTGNAGADC